MKVIILLLSMFSIVWLIACTDTNNTAIEESANQDGENQEKTEKVNYEIPERDNWTLSSKFEHTVEPESGEGHTYEIVGNKNTLGFTGPFPIVSKQPQKYMWFYFGKENIYDIPVEVKAIKKGTDKVVNIDSGTFFEGAEVSPNSVNMPSHLRFPSAGVWKLLIYIDKKHFESIVVHVE
ncbi:hypothetical protein [Sediminibacillus albus]|uniref:DUF4871 domain-containing protein n=1 Tax=Sediminibacillus albus TaxID=407036 RepID=A0A1G9A2C2_9BACI|nr:hypothetical protein [Sediminibacillus albus]SDK20994.1 hypothetical protein SAMN05216243_2342 [Sediminibacillus albus]